MPIISVIRLVYLVRAVDFVALRQSDPTINLDLTCQSSKSLSELTLQRYRANEEITKGNFVDITILSVLEPSLGLISCCLPALQYVFAQILRNTISSTRNQSGGSSGKHSLSLKLLKNGKSSRRQDESFVRLDEALGPASVDHGSPLDSAHQTQVMGNPFHNVMDDRTHASNIHVQDEVDLSWEEREGHAKSGALLP